MIFFFYLHTHKTMSSRYINNSHQKKAKGKIHSPKYVKPTFLHSTRLDPIPKKDNWVALDRTRDPIPEKVNWVTLDRRGTVSLVCWDESHFHVEQLCGRSMAWTNDTFVLSAPCRSGKDFLADSVGTRLQRM